MPRAAGPRDVSIRISSAAPSNNQRTDGAIQAVRTEYWHVRRRRIPNFGKNSHALPRRSSVAAQIFFASQFPLGVLRAHVAHCSKDRPLRPPGSVVSPQAPEDAVIRVGVATVESEAVIELDHDFN